MTRKTGTTRMTRRRRLGSRRGAEDKKLRGENKSDE